MSSATTHIQAHPAADEAVIKALATATPRPAPRAGALPTVLVLAFGWRGMLKIKHVPEQLMDVTIMPVLIVFLYCR